MRRNAPNSLVIPTDFYSLKTLSIALQIPYQVERVSIQKENLIDFKLEETLEN